MAPGAAFGRTFGKNKMQSCCTFDMSVLDEDIKRGEARELEMSLRSVMEPSELVLFSASVHLECQYPRLGAPD